jgi:general secretion pathway protein C
MLSRAAAFVIWALVAAASVFWLLRLNAQGPTAPKAALANPQALATRAELSRVLGSTPVVAAPSAASPELSSRFVLSGVMAPKGASSTGSAQGRTAGLALIAVDGKPPKPFALGAKVDGDWVLLAVSLRSASIGPAGGAPVLTLELPALPAPATGSFAPVALDNSTPVPVRAPAAPPVGAAPPPPPPPGNRMITAEQAR